MQVAGVLLVLYLLAAYYVMPMVEKRRLGVNEADAISLPAVTLKFNRIPGDPLNVAIVGTEFEVRHAMSAAAWYRADHLSVRSFAREVRSILGGKGYFSAPVSNLYCFGRRQDLAFEQPDGKFATRRHHVRFWQVPGSDAKGRLMWVGAATFDRGIGLSRLTGELTHHIDPAVDAERDKVLADLQQAQRVMKYTDTHPAGPIFDARNGEGDHYHSDGRMAVIILPTIEPPMD